MSVFIGAENIAKAVGAIDIGVDAVARECTEGWIGVDAIAREVWSKDMSLSDLSVGDSVYMDVDGVSTEFIVVHQGLPSSDYDTSCDGTWLLMKDPTTILPLVGGDEPDLNVGEYWGGEPYDSSIFHNTILPTFIDCLDPAIINTVKTVKIPYWGDTEDPSQACYMSGSSGLDTQAFLLSATEIGNYNEYGLYPEGTTLDYFINASESDRIAYYNGTACAWYTRTVGSVSSQYQVIVNPGGYPGELSNGVVTILGVTEVGVRPALILPSDTAIDENFSIIPPEKPKIGSLEVGETVYMNVNGISKEFIIVHQGLPSSDYDSSCDGTWLLMKDAFNILDLKTDGKFFSKYYNETSIYTTLNNVSDYLDSAVANIVKTVKIPYLSDRGDSNTIDSWVIKTGADGLSVKAFLLSIIETGIENEYRPVEGSKLDYFKDKTDSERILYVNGVKTWWFLRTPSVGNRYTLLTISDYGYNTDIMAGMVNQGVVTKTAVRPALILPSDTIVDFSYNVMA